MKHFFAALTLFALGCFSAARAQEDKGFFFADNAEKAYYELYTIPQPALTESRIIVMFRVRYDALVFGKADLSKRGEGAFMAMPIVQIEFTDSDGIIRANKEWRDTIYVDSFQKTTSKDDYAYGHATVTLPPRSYAFALDIGEKTIPRVIKMRNKSVLVANTGAAQNSTIGAPIFAAMKPNAPDTVYPLCMNNTVAMNAPSKAVFGVSDVHERDGYSYGIHRVLDGKGHLSLPLASGRINARLNIALAEPRRALANQQILVLAPVPVPASVQPEKERQVGVVEVPLPMLQMEEGAYQVWLVKEGSRDTVAQTFDVEWLGKPHSLRNTEYAIDILHYILTDAEYNTLRRGSDDLVHQKFDAFWKQRDPTPQTAYNEALYAYYSRVDYAFFTFVSPQAGIADGAKTERGKVYILCGKPTSTDVKSNSIKGLIETWRYDNKVRKEFIFEVPKNSEVVLKSVREL